jgi:hypothetical protein
MIPVREWGQVKWRKGGFFETVPVSGRPPQLGLADYENSRTPEVGEPRT